MIRKVNVKDCTHEEWMSVRSGTVGGSEAGAVVGLSPYQSPFGLWCEKTGRSKPFEGNLTTEVGSYLEEFVAHKFSEVTGLKVERSNFIYFNDNFSDQHATPDRLLKATKSHGLSGLKCGLEIKTTSVFTKLKDNAVPEIYYAQCVQYLSVMEYDIWFLAVLVGNRELHIYELRRSDKFPVPEFVEGELVVEDSEVYALRDACTEFMDMVRSDTPPIADGSDATVDAINEVYSTSEPETETTLGDEWGDLFEVLSDLTRKQKETEEQINTIKNRIKVEMGTNEVAKCGSYYANWKSSFSNSLDTKKLKAELPEVYAKYARKTQKRTFTFGTRKENKDE